MSSSGADTAGAPPRPERVEPVSLSTLSASSGATLAASEAGEDVLVTGVTLRAHHVRPGDLFAAVPGARVHGADFAEQAVAAGAVAVLTDRDGAERPGVLGAGVPVLVHDDPRGSLGSIASRVYGDPSLRLSVLGVTGTSGKTTTAYLLEAALRAAGRCTGLIGTVETLVAGRRLDSAFTTPEAPDLQALFALMLEQGVTHVPMEVSSHALALGRVNGTRFAVGAFTNLSQDHLDFHRDMADYFAAKSLLFDGRSSTEVVVVDTSWGQRLVGEHTVTVTAEPGTRADWQAGERAVEDAGRQSFVLSGPDGVRASVALPLPGGFNVANATLAAAVLDSAGVSLEDSVAGLAAVQVPGRMERVAVGQSFTAVVDYAHKPAAVAVALESLRARTNGRIITVLGCGGDRDVAKRPMMGEAAALGSDLLIVTDDNPRSEQPGEIRSAVLAGARSVDAAARAELLEIGDRSRAIGAAVRRAESGDVVLVAGKGHEKGQKVGEDTLPFSDRDELEAALRRFVVGEVGS